MGYHFCDETLYSDRTRATRVLTEMKIFDIAFGIILILFILYFTFQSWKEIKSRIQNFNYAAAQISYIVAVFVKGISYIFVGVTLGKLVNWSAVSAISLGLSGYITGIAYCFIFFSWASVCAKYLGHDFSLFFKSSRIALYSLIALMVIFFIVTSVVMFLDEYTWAHYVESCFAAFRDLVLALFFFIYFKKILKLAEPPYFDFSRPESLILTLIIVLIVTLILRATSIIMYALFWSDWGLSGNKKRECTDIYFSSYAFDQILFEIFPLIMIGVTKIHQSDEQEYEQIEDQIQTM